MKKQMKTNKQIYKRQISKLYIGIGFLIIATVAVTLIILLPDKKTDLQDGIVKTSFTKHGTASFFDKKGNLIVDFEIEIADTKEAMSQGLMYRESIEPNQAMLFVYDEPQVLSFWMKNTYIPLDMIFISADSIIVSIHPNSIPFSEEQISSYGPALYVLEVNAGIAQKYDLQPGDKFVWRRD